jgi:SSS family solute:Na+ symporter
MNAALLIIGVTVAFSTVLGIYAGRCVRMNLEMWTVGGRQFGVVLMWLLMAGEIYTTFTFLGAAGWAYSKGAPAFYILIYMTLAYVISFFILPPVWEAGKRHGMHTLPDFFSVRYQSRSLGIVAALIGVISILPYLQLQLTGLGLIVQVASRGAISAELAMVLGFLATALFVFTSGIRGIAWVSVVKNIMMILAIGIAGIAVPYHWFGGIDKMFQVLIREKGPHLLFPGATANLDVQWVMSTVLLTSLGFYMWPQNFGSVFSARSANTIRRNAIIMPLYQAPLLLIFCAGFTALLVLPGLKNGDMAFLAIVQATFPDWFLGFVGAAGAVTAMVPASVLILCASTLMTKNIYQAAIHPHASESLIMILSRAMAILITLVALCFSIAHPRSLVQLLLAGFNGVAQFFPGVVLGLFWKQTTRVAVFAGLFSGIGVVLVLMISQMDPFLGLNAGFVALAVNFAITLAVSLATRRPALDAQGFD